MDVKFSVFTIAVVAVVTFLLRFLPFIIFKGKKTPEFISYLGRILPFAIMGMLVVFCLKNVSVVSYPFGIPELIAAAVVVILHVWKRNTLISISMGTICYMLLVQFVFV